MRKAANVLLLSLYLTGTFLMNSEAQIKKPVKWHFGATPINKEEAILTFTAFMEEGWHIYSQFIEEGGPLPTTITFEPSNDYTLIGKIKEESTPLKKFDVIFGMPIAWFEKTAVFTQRVKLNGPSATIKGKVEFMVCTDVECLLPEEKRFSLEAKVDMPDSKNSGQDIKPKEKSKTKGNNDAPC